MDELRDLVSWQEAYRRGDLSFSRGAPHAYPLQQQYRELNDNNDDGYSSASPAASSDISSLFSLNSPTSSSSAQLVDLNDLSVDDLLATDHIPTREPAHIGSAAAAYPATLNGDGEFDLDQLFGDDLYDLYDSFPRRQMEPSDTASSSVNSLDYASPFIERHLDEYLGSFGHVDEQNGLDDPFCMPQFTQPSEAMSSAMTAGFDCLPYSASVQDDITSPYEGELDVNGEDTEASSASGETSNNSKKNLVLLVLWAWIWFCSTTTAYLGSK